MSAGEPAGPARPGPARPSSTSDFGYLTSEPTVPRGFSETRTRWRVLECPSRAHAHTPRGNYYDQHPPHFGTVERVTGPRFRFNLHLFHVGMGRPTACPQGTN